MKTYKYVKTGMENEFCSNLNFLNDLRVLLVENYWSEQSGKDDGASLKRRPLELQKYYRNLLKIIQKRWRILVSAIMPLQEGKEWIIIIITNSYYSFKKFLHFWLAKIPPIIYHNWLLSNKFGRILQCVKNDVNCGAA